jgi:hypothetical protein
MECKSHRISAPPLHESWIKILSAAIADPREEVPLRLV